MQEIDDIAIDIDINGKQIKIKKKTIKNYNILNKLYNHSQVNKSPVLKLCSNNFTDSDLLLLDRGQFHPEEINDKLINLLNELDASKTIWSEIHKLRDNNEFNLKANSQNTTNEFNLGVNSQNVNNQFNPNATNEFNLSVNSQNVNNQFNPNATNEFNFGVNNQFNQNATNEFNFGVNSQNPNNQFNQNATNGFNLEANSQNVNNQFNFGVNSQNVNNQFNPNATNEFNFGVNSQNVNNQFNPNATNEFNFGVNSQNVNNQFNPNTTSEFNLKANYQNANYQNATSEFNLGVNNQFNLGANNLNVTNVRDRWDQIIPLPLLKLFNGLLLHNHQLVTHPDFHQYKTRTLQLMFTEMNLPLENVYEIGFSPIHPIPECHISNVDDFSTDLLRKICLSSSSLNTFLDSYYFVKGICFNDKINLYPSKKIIFESTSKQVVVFQTKSAYVVVYEGQDPSIKNERRQIRTCLDEIAIVEFIVMKDSADLFVVMFDAIQCKNFFLCVLFKALVCDKIKLIKRMISKYRGYLSLFSDKKMIMNILIRLIKNNLVEEFAIMFDLFCNSQTFDFRYFLLVLKFSASVSNSSFSKMILNNQFLSLNFKNELIKKELAQFVSSSFKIGSLNFVYELDAYAKLINQESNYQSQLIHKIVCQWMIDILIFFPWRRTLLEWGLAYFFAIENKNLLQIEIIIHFNINNFHELEKLYAYHKRTTYFENIFLRLDYDLGTFIINTLIKEGVAFIREIK
jgi:hypothetical protein